MDDVAIALSKDFDGHDNITEIMGRYHQKLEPLVNAFIGFHDLEDDDGDEDDEAFPGVTLPDQTMRFMSPTTASWDSSFLAVNRLIKS
jgi:hypothetical protein